MSHHENLEQVLGHLRKLHLADDEVEEAMVSLNNVVQGYGRMESIRVARVEDPTEVTAYVAMSNKDFGSECSPHENVVRTKRQKLLLVGYHYDHSR